MSRNEIGLNIAPGLAELRAARRESNGLLLAVFLFSVFYNLLLFTGPLYMMQVYDRVLGANRKALDALATAGAQTSLVEGLTSENEAFYGEVDFDAELTGSAVWASKVVMFG